MVQQKPALRDFQPLTLNSLFLFSREFKKFNNTNKFYNHEIKITPIRDKIAISCM